MLTRLAPSPTGALHLGNARTFFINWLMARQAGWRVVLRIEDIDGPRIKAGTDQAAIDDLRWLGMDWDDGPVYQSARLELYHEAIKKLITAGKAYPCVCSRKEIEQAASAPHAEDGAAVYPGTCRGRFKSIADATAFGSTELVESRSAERIETRSTERVGVRLTEPVEVRKPPAIRFAVPAGEIISFVDDFAGLKSYDVASQLGDFVIAKADGTPAYQLAVVVDDAAMGVTHVVRGDDLIDSTPRQILLYRALGLEPAIPRHYHLPLVIGEDGRRLAKRHGDTRLATYRAAGVPAGRLRAWLAKSIGLDCGDDVSVEELQARFEIGRVPRKAVVFTAADDRFFRGIVARKQ